MDAGGNHSQDAKCDDVLRQRWSGRSVGTMASGTSRANAPSFISRKTMEKRGRKRTIPRPDCSLEGRTERFSQPSGTPGFALRSRLQRILNVPHSSPVRKERFFSAPLVLLSGGFPKKEKKLEKIFRTTPPHALEPPKSVIQKNLCKFYNRRRAKFKRKYKAKRAQNGQSAHKLKLLIYPILSIILRRKSFANFPILCKRNKSQDKKNIKNGLDFHDT